MKFVSETIKLRPLTLADLPFAMELKTRAGWNQLEADWEFLIDSDKGGNFVAAYNGQKCGIATSFAYNDRFSWIGMVLVAPAYRGMGIGTTLLKAAISFCESIGTVRLDATPEGKKLYTTLGFETEMEILRLESAKNVLMKSERKCNTIDKCFLNELAKFDAPIFGARRDRVLRYLLNNSPKYAFCVKSDNRISGYCLGRSGSKFDHIGPVVAERQKDARNLLITAMASRTDKPVIIDTYGDNPSWLEILYSLGFKIQRPLTRMYLGDLKFPGIPKRQYAIAGPELG